MDKRILTAVQYRLDADMHWEEGRGDLARELYEKAIVLFLEAGQEYLRELASCYASLAEIYRNEDRYALAISYYEKAIDAREKRVKAPPNSDLIREILYHDTPSPFENPTPEMQRVMRRIVSYYTVAGVFDLIDNYLEIGFLYRKTDMYEESAVYLARSIPYMEAISPIAPDTLADRLPVTLYILGKLYREMKNSEKMRHYCEKALILMQREPDKFRRHIKEMREMLI